MNPSMGGFAAASLPLKTLANKHHFKKGPASWVGWPGLGVVGIWSWVGGAGMAGAQNSRKLFFLVIILQ